MGVGVGRGNDTYDFLQPEEIDFLSAPKKDSFDQQKPNSSSQIPPTKIVENRRQVFEKSYSLNKPPTPSQQQQQQQQQLQQPSPSQTPPQQQQQPAKSVDKISPEKPPLERKKSSTPLKQSLTLDGDKSNDAKQQQKKRKDDECRQIMSRGNIETVAERAAHFEEIDLEKFNRLKSRLDEYDWYGQDNGEQANASRNPLADKKNLRMLLYGYTDAKNLPNEAFYNYEKYLSTLNPIKQQDVNNNNMPVEYLKKQQQAGFAPYRLGYEGANSNELTNASYLINEIPNSDRMQFEKNSSSPIKSTMRPTGDEYSNEMAAAAAKFHAAMMRSNKRGESEIISTDSDIGTSPSGTTYASQPSSPQQVNFSTTTDNSPNCSIPDSNMYNFFMDNIYNKKYPPPGVMMNSNHQQGRSNDSSSNEQDLIMMMRKDSPGASNQQLKQSYLDVIDQLRDLSITSKKQIGNFNFWRFEKLWEIYCCLRIWFENFLF